MHYHRIWGTRSSFLLEKEWGNKRDYSIAKLETRQDAVLYCTSVQNTRNSSFGRELVKRGKYTVPSIFFLFSNRSPLACAWCWVVWRRPPNKHQSMFHRLFWKGWTDVKSWDWCPTAILCIGALNTTPASPENMGTIAAETRSFVLVAHSCNSELFNIWNNTFFFRRAHPFVHGCCSIFLISIVCVPLTHKTCQSCRAQIIGSQKETKLVAKHHVYYTALALLVLGEGAGFKMLFPACLEKEGRGKKINRCSQRSPR